MPAAHCPPLVPHGELAVPVHWLHFPGNPDDCSLWEVVKLIKQVSDVGLVLQVQVYLDDLCYF